MHIILYYSLVFMYAHLDENSQRTADQPPLSLLNQMSGLNCCHSISSILSLFVYLLIVKCFSCQFGVLLLLLTLVSCLSCFLYFVWCFRTAVLLKCTIKINLPCIAKTNYRQKQKDAQQHMCVKSFFFFYILFLFSLLFFCFLSSIAALWLLNVFDDGWSLLNDIKEIHKQGQLVA